MAGKLEIRVVPKDQSRENVPKEENLSVTKVTVNATMHDTTVDSMEKCNNDAHINVVCNQKAKKILKQSSKERNESSTDLQSPNKEKVTFAPEISLCKNVAEKEMKKRISLECDQNPEAEPKADEENGVKEKCVGTEKISPETADVAIGPKTSEKLINTDVCKVEHESTSTEIEQKNSKEKSDKQKFEIKANNNRLSMINNTSSPVINVETVLPLSRSNSQKAISKQLEAVKNNLVDSRSDSSSSTQCRINDKVNVDECVEMDGKPHLTVAEVKDKINCSPAVDLTSNPAVTFVSPSSIPDIK